MICQCKFQCGNWKFSNAINKLYATDKFILPFFDILSIQGGW